MSQIHQSTRLNKINTLFECLCVNVSPCNIIYLHFTKSQNICTTTRIDFSSVFLAKHLKLDGGQSYTVKAPCCAVVSPSKVPTRTRCSHE